MVTQTAQSHYLYSQEIPLPPITELGLKFTYKKISFKSARGQWVNSLSPGRSGCDSKKGIFNLVLLIGIFRSSHDNALWWMPQVLTANIGSGNGLVLSGNKPLPEPDLCHHMASLGHSELIKDQVHVLILGTQVYFIYIYVFVFFHREQLTLCSDVLQLLLERLDPATLLPQFHDELLAGLAHPAPPVKHLALKQVHCSTQFAKK